jgi:hypothetical protein
LLASQERFYSVVIDDYGMRITESFFFGKEGKPIRRKCHLFHVETHEPSDEKKLILSEIKFIMKTDGYSFFSGKINEDILN